jgi:hypothetical protein
MTSPKRMYSVILRADLPDQDRTVFVNLGKDVEIAEGGRLLYLECKSIDDSHHTYLTAEVIRPTDKKVFMVRVPHYLVLTIAGNEASSGIGFLAELKDA